MLRIHVEMVSAVTVVADFRLETFQLISRKSSTDRWRMRRRRSAVRTGSTRWSPGTDSQCRPPPTVAGC